jgi:transposase
MLAQPATARQQSPPASAGGSPRHAAGTPPSAVIGGGIDTSRYGHYAAFLNDQLQTAAPELAFTESAAGYAQLRQRFVDFVPKHGRVRFRVRLDVAGAYADNLLYFLHSLAGAAGSDAALAGADFAFSCGDPQRNKNYRAALFGPQKSDPVEARACARYAVTEKPKPMPRISAERQRLRHVALRLQAVVRQRTRLVNQLHQLLARTFPELALLVQDLSTGWVLELLTRYPTAKVLAQASADDLQNIPYLPHARVADLLAAARHAIASLHGELADELIRDQVRQVRDGWARQKRLENLLVLAYRDLPDPNHLDTIKGFGEVTAAILTAFVADIDAVEPPGQLVSYFGVLPIEASSGVDRDGNPRGPKRYVMSRRGNDLVRRYLWMVALSAARHNPACRALYARVRAKHPDRPAIAIGHVMRKLLHLAFAIWKTGKPFDPSHYPWHAPAHVERQAESRAQEAEGQARERTSDMAMSPEERAAGLKPVVPARSEVTAARENAVAASATASRERSRSEATHLDFAHRKAQLSMARVVDHLGLSPRLKGTGPQRRGPCPLHRGDGRGRTFSVHLGDNVFHCHDARCGQQGDVIDRWAAARGLSLRDAALDLVRTFDLEACPGTEKRNG